MQEFANAHSMRNKILSLMTQHGLEDDCYLEMLDYTIDLFESQGLGTEYYGYHNINHELEVTYVSLLAINQEKIPLTEEDKKYLYVAALFHDFDPQKNVDKPHEESVLKFISTDKKLQKSLAFAKIDLEIIKVLILRTTYPWSGQMRKDAEIEIKKCFERSDITKNNQQTQKHIMELGRYLSVVDRISGYLLGDFTKAMEMAKMNAHALAWRPSIIVRTSVAYFEELLNKETSMVKAILKELPKEMRKNFFDTILSFMRIREQEVSIQANYSYENLKLIPTIENQSMQDDAEFVQTLYDIFLELPKPLQFGKEKFKESIKNPKTIINTLRLNNNNGEIVGFAKGGPLEEYQLREEIRDENYGLKNTVFLEPLALKMGYWGLRGGSEMRHMFIMQAHSMKYKFMTSFALRDVIRARIDKEEAEFVQVFDPERWDYYRVRL
ncbi:MAG: HD domain-containing protein [Nitrosopumilus sp.]|jgi:hypothetical protein|nr:HD domain-containing protein [Nitrosopumilus sp.]MDC4229355.1 HD domain-containing protein [Nitrosopumilus sp.]MDC4230115.1 HD domain-containing protein [Nitrosopumilus sp.]